MGDQEGFVEKLSLIANQARTCVETLSKIEASREETGRLPERSVDGDQRPEGAGTGERAGSVSPSRREGVNINSRLQTIGEVEVARGSSLA